jgi:acyl-CoA dehydrogenase
MAVRTGPPGSGAKGISLLLVPLKNTPGVKMRRLAVSGVTSSGTTYISLEDVRVPINHLLGEENQGMRYIMTNFNHERLVVATGVTRQARVALTAAFEYVFKREAFGKPLVEQPVVRHRLAKAGALLESQTAWVEQFAYMMTKMPHEQAGILLGGPTALLKAHAGMVFKKCADTAVLLFGGNGYTKTGQGQLVESEFCICLPSCFGYRTDDAAHSVVPGSHGREDPRRVRGCPARLGCAAAGQDLQDANQNAGG